MESHIRFKKSHNFFFMKVALIDGHITCISWVLDVITYNNVFGWAYRFNLTSQIYQLDRGTATIYEFSTVTMDLIPSIVTVLNRALKT
jgi:hypothetical protein